MSFGPNPWQQTSWDWRAAGNFIGGGAGTGLLFACAFFAAPLADSAWTSNWLLLVGLALVGGGLTCVWLEIGRPQRALHVFFNPYTSWMSREGFVGLLLFPAVLMAVLGFGGWIWASAVLALLFLYCQSRMLPAAKGIPAWRSKLVTPLVFVTGLCEGYGVFLLLGLVHARVSGSAMLSFTALVLVRIAVWTVYRRVVDASLASRARAALDLAGYRLVLFGTIAPLVLLGTSLVLPAGVVQAGLIAAAGASAALAGAFVKYILVTRASFNQGFALKHIPVRGVRAPS
jgi:phenylacetyl-CoA:acceptor oxidoreductase subunit 2